MGVIQEFIRKKTFLIGIDSDGCAIDTMNSKHIHCFGPCMLEEWGLEEWKEPILKRWNEINLYSKTRGINRFKGLALALEEIDKTYCHIEDLDGLKHWVETTAEWSNGSVEKAASETGSPALKRALSWSRKVNQAITELPKDLKKPFSGVKEALEAAHQRADIAIISSANSEAVTEEWKRHGLLEHVDIMLTQDVGSKAFCIREMLKKGYEADHVLMMGDAPGDWQAALENEVLFYPILVQKEEASWKQFIEEGLDCFLEQKYEGDYQKKRIQEFEENLS